MSVLEYLRKEHLPHIWCSGCGHGIVLGGILRAVDELGISKTDVVMVSGIGCSSRAPGYVDFHTLHTLHGRALAFATGVKLANQRLTIIIPMGDGDAMAIGGNHFIQSCRRNIDLTAIILNNSVYGMTGGQYSPLTPLGKLATTAPHGNADNPFDTVELARGAGATYIARSTTYHARAMINLIKKAIQHKGFSVVEVFSQCPTYYGRKNHLGSGEEMMKLYRKITTPIGSKAKKENLNLIEIGEFLEIEKQEYCEEYARLIDKAMRRGIDG